MVNEGIVNHRGGKQETNEVKVVLVPGRSSEYFVKCTK